MAIARGAAVSCLLNGEEKVCRVTNTQRYVADGIHTVLVSDGITVSEILHPEKGSIFIGQADLERRVRFLSEDADTYCPLGRRNCPSFGWGRHGEYGHLRNAFCRVVPRASIVIWWFQKFWGGRSCPVSGIPVEVLTEILEHDYRYGHFRSSQFVANREGLPVRATLTSLKSRHRFLHKPSGRTVWAVGGTWATYAETRSLYPMGGYRPIQTDTGTVCGTFCHPFDELLGLDPRFQLSLHFTAGDSEVDDSVTGFPVTTDMLAGHERGFQLVRFFSECELQQEVPG